MDEADRRKTELAWAKISPDRTLWNHPYTTRMIDKRGGAGPEQNWTQRIHAELLGGKTFRQALSLDAVLEVLTDLYTVKVYSTVSLVSIYRLTRSRQRR
jgi:hypothetical protein